MYHMTRYDSIFPKDHETMWRKILNEIEDVTEIRIRAERPILIYRNRNEISIDQEGNFIYVPQKGKIFSYQELQKLLDFWCMDSRYAFQNEIKRGFLTIQGGHRIGICGEVINDEKGNIQTIKYISAVNIRIAHEIKNVAQRAMKYIYGENIIENTLIVSPPGAGKTTLLRDIIRRMSYGDDVHAGVNVGVVDERGEIAACFQGIPQLDIGPRTDVLDNCTKTAGMRILLRAMSPRVIAVDELGNLEEIQLIQQIAGSGCAVMATIHGESMEELKQKKMLKEVWEQHIFQNVICLSKEKNTYHMEVYRMKEGKLCYVY